MKRAYLNLLLVLSLALAPLHNVLAMQAVSAAASSSSSKGCAEMNHHGGHKQVVGVVGHADGATDDRGHAVGLCNDCASCVHCAIALNFTMTIPVSATAIHHQERRVPLRTIDVHPDLRPPRLS